jgi:hypothetical protein
MPDPNGLLWEMPIYTRMVPFWRMLGGKRLKLQNRMLTSGHSSPLPRRWRDFLRLQYPQKLDFCRMTFDEMRDAIVAAIGDQRGRSEEDSVIVAIGHSKDFVDSDSVWRFLNFLQERSIKVTTFSRLLGQESPVAGETCLCNLS